MPRLFAWAKKFVLNARLPSSVEPQISYQTQSGNIAQIGWCGITVDSMASKNSFQDRRIEPHQQKRPNPVTEDLAVNSKIMQYGR